MLIVSSHPHDGSTAKLLNNVTELQTISSGTVSSHGDMEFSGWSCDLFKVGDALKALAEHKVALEQAEKIEQVANMIFVWSHDHILYRSLFHWWPDIKNMKKSSLQK